MTYTTAQPQLRAAIIGSGFMGSTHASAIRAAGGQVKAVLASREGAQENAKRATGAEFVSTSLTEILGRHDIDVVHVCTPNASHEEFAIRALAAGKAIVCEKPLSTSSESTGHILTAAEAAGQIGTVPFVYRFHPMIRELRARIVRGDLGLPSVVHGGYLQDWLTSSDDSNWRVGAEQGGTSRAFADIGSHWFDLFEFVTGDHVTRLSAQISTVISERGGSPVSTEDAASVQFRTAGGMLGTMVVSQVSAGRKNRLHLEISGTETSFAFDQENPEKLWLGKLTGSIDLPRDPGNLTADAARLSFLPAGHPQGYQDAFTAFVRDSYSFIADPTASGDIAEATPTLAAGHRAAVLCDAVLASARRDGEWVDPTDSPQNSEPAA
ncbi:putative dehydrogenase [Homoserinimonas aerilata]|uniref:Putative dehydrogenase n=1 Tax=Homoserinimonas aerilata TaxID=1162970 RepID=A0A542YLC9_9MICO|nr:Gfo/Idh/MocA family oxidoreductase [Homoserinimonas aerilata]TQL48851.1 putative dehydrogenase [Homoserinimonas aerilata]